MPFLKRTVEAVQHVADLANHTTKTVGQVQDLHRHVQNTQHVQGKGEVLKHIVEGVGIAAGVIITAIEAGSKAKGVARRVSHGIQVRQRAQRIFGNSKRG